MSLPGHLNPRGCNLFAKSQRLKRSRMPTAIIPKYGKVRLGLVSKSKKFFLPKPKPRLGTFQREVPPSGCRHLYFFGGSTQDPCVNLFLCTAAAHVHGTVSEPNPMLASLFLEQFGEPDGEPGGLRDPAGVCVPLRSRRRAQICAARSGS